MGGISVEEHLTENTWNPELTFGHLLTSSNYDDNQKKVVGGRNGYGAKLANIFSSEFVIDIKDSENKNIIFKNGKTTCPNVTHQKLQSFQELKSSINIILNLTGLVLK